MSDYEDYDYGREDHGHGGSEKGLTAETVLQIRKFVLGNGPIEPLIEDQPEVLAAREAAQPPRRHGGRFAPGQSGNPRGRPKKAFSPKSVPQPELDQDQLAAVVRQLLDREMPVTYDGEVQQRPLRDILIERQVQRAAKGSTAATRFLDALDLRAKQAEARVQAQDYAIWKDRKERYAALHEKARKRMPNTVHWGCPHPDDIILGPGHKVQVVGPMSPDELIRTRARHDRSAFWLMLSTYEGWMQVRRAKTHPGCPHIHAELVSSYMFEAEQQLLPPRLRMTRDEVEARVRDWSSLAGRALHDLLRTEAAKLGMPVPPRALRVPFTMLHPLSEEVVPEVAAIDRPCREQVGDREGALEELFRTAWAAMVEVV